MIYCGAAQPFEAVFESGVTGLTGIVEVAVIDNDGVTVIGPTTLNITENIVDGVPTGVYTWNAPAAPATSEQYTITWSPDGTWNPISVSIEDLVVVTATPGQLPPIPPPVGGGIVSGPCTAWTISDDVLACCNADVDSDPSVFDDYVVAASQILFQLSGRLFSGLCEKTVRPCRANCGCGFQVLSRGHIVWPDDSFGWMGDSWGCGGTPCGCAPLSRVKLSGYPVREVTQVKIDGLIVNPDTYRLDEHHYLTRVRDPLDPATVLFWPNCQLLDLDDTNPGTFSVTYTYGQNPPMIGQSAATELACELFKQCNGATDCALPSGVTRITRQGVVIERLAFSAWGIQKNHPSEAGVWKTGMPWVDAFLNSVNRDGSIRRPSTWSPDGMKFARQVGS